MTEKQDTQTAQVAADLQEIAQNFADEIGRKPTSKEFFEILTCALQSMSGVLLSDVNPSNVIALKPELTPGTKGYDEGSAKSAVAELNDATFVAATNAFMSMIEIIREATAQPPALKDLLRLLPEGLGRSDNLLADIDSRKITKVQAEFKDMKKTVVKPGDIIAIPAKNDEYFRAVVLGKNRFGVAYGLFKGTGKDTPISKDSHPPVNPHPIYSDDKSIVDGRWKIIGHDEGLLSLFPSDPEIYHYQHEDDPDPEIGPYGSGETASGRLRALSKKEADELGLTSEEYRQAYMSEYLENYLNKKLS
jgi:hypothetical protein